MKNKTIKNNKQGHHDDCQDCRRQKKENDELIAIYERLQLIDNNSKLMRRSLDKHKQQFQNTASKFKQFSFKLNQAPTQTKADIEIKNLGIQLCYSMMNEVANGPTIKQNEQLKRKLIQLHRPKKRYQDTQKQTHRQFSINTDNQLNNSTNKSQLYQSQYQTRTQFNKSFQRSLRNSIVIEKIKEVVQPCEQTRTTSFFSQESKPKQKQCSNRIDGLSLWLYQENANKNLEEELYQTRIPIRARGNKVSKTKGTVLPALKTTRNKF